MQLSQYSTQSVHVKEDVHKTQAPQVPVQEAQKPLVQEQEPPLSDAPKHSPAPILKGGQSLVAREEKIEYRDQDGNLLDPEQVKELEGKVSFKTRYETRTRMVDKDGNVINAVDPDEPKTIAPPHPEGIDRETVNIKQNVEESAPAAQRDISADESKEESVEKSKTGDAKPASEVNEATA